MNHSGEGKRIGKTEHIIQDTMESGEDHFIKDQWGREYHFRIGAFPYPTGPFIEAVEVKQEFCVCLNNLERELNAK